MSGVGGNGQLAFGISAMQGWREEMEDAHLALPDFDTHRNLGLFGVFDGHGGAAVSALVAERLPGDLRALPAFKEGRYQDALREAFLGMDVYLSSVVGRKEVRRRAFGEGPEGMGTTAVVALVRGGDDPELIVANAGDSRCVLVSGTVAVDMSQDHSPYLPAERRRIMEAGGFVNKEGRVNGNLNLSRALGDLFYKKNRKLKPERQLISGEPEVRTRRLGGSDRYLVLACDGIWERATSQQVVDFLLAHLADAKDVSGSAFAGACSAFLGHNISKNPIRTQGLGCDNMTLALLDLQTGKPVEASPPDGGKAPEAPSPRTAATKRRIPLPWLSRSQRRRLTMCRLHMEAEERLLATTEWAEENPF